MLLQQGRSRLSHGRRRRFGFGSHEFDNDRFFFLFLNLLQQIFHDGHGCCCSRQISQVLEVVTVQLGRLELKPQNHFEGCRQGQNTTKPGRRSLHSLESTLKGGLNAFGNPFQNFRLTLQPMTTITSCHECRRWSGKVRFVRSHGFIQVLGFFSFSVFFSLLPFFGNSFRCNGVAMESQEGSSHGFGAGA